MRSLIQLAGRVRRHRPGAVGGVNIVALDSNLRRYERPQEPAYQKPGFEIEQKPFRLKSHDLHDLLAREFGQSEAWAVDAQPRVTLPPDNKLYPDRHLVDLEHARMHDSMLPKAEGAKVLTCAAYLHWYEPDETNPRSLWLTGLLPQFQRFRHDPLPREDVVLLPDDDGETLRLHRVQDDKQRKDNVYVPIHQSLCHTVPLEQMTASNVSPWPRVDLMKELDALAQAQHMSLQRCAQRYATASLPQSQAGWWWHERLGFTEKA
jgi:CRISPR-associated endonuclease/helicase Cas3